MMNNSVKVIKTVEKFAKDYKKLTGENIEIKIHDGAVTTEDGRAILTDIGTFEFQGNIVEINDVIISKENINNADAEGIATVLENITHIFKSHKNFVDNYDAFSAKYIEEGIKFYGEIVEFANVAQSKATEYAMESDDEHALDELHYMTQRLDDAVRPLSRLHSLVKSNLNLVKFTGEGLTFKTSALQHTDLRYEFEGLIEEATKAQTATLVVATLSELGLVQ